MSQVNNRAKVVNVVKVMKRVIVIWNSEMNPPKLRGRPPGSKYKPKKNNLDKNKQISRKY